MPEIFFLKNGAFWDHFYEKKAYKVKILQKKMKNFVCVNDVVNGSRLGGKGLAEKTNKYFPRFMTHNTFF